MSQHSQSSVFRERAIQVQNRLIGRLRSFHPGPMLYEVVQLGAVTYFPRGRGDDVEVEPADAELQ